MPSELTYLPICGPCIRGEGSECHTPGCALWLRDVPPDGLISEFAVDLSEIRREGAAEVVARAEATIAPDDAPMGTMDTLADPAAVFVIERVRAAIRGDA